MANYVLAFHTLAREEVREAYQYYESEQKGLGQQFIDKLDALFNLLLENPHLFAKDFEEVRKAPMKKFPFSVYYEIVGDKIFVYSVFHQSRKPEDWKRRV
jgi:plasmid stabilization system protein ParE